MSKRNRDKRIRTAVVSGFRAGAYAGAGDDPEKMNPWRGKYRRWWREAFNKGLREAGRVREMESPPAAPRIVAPRPRRLILPG